MRQLRASALTPSKPHQWDRRHRAVRLVYAHQLTVGLHCVPGHTKWGPRRIDTGHLDRTRHDGAIPRICVMFATPGRATVTKCGYSAKEGDHGNAVEHPP